MAWIVDSKGFQALYGGFQTMGLRVLIIRNIGVLFGALRFSRLLFLGFSLTGYEA